MKRLSTLVTYSLPVIHVENSKRQFQSNMSPTGSFHVHFITFRNKNGQEFVGEYVTEYPNQDVFMPGNVMAFKVKEAQAKGDVIIPLLDYSQNVEIKLNPEHLKPVTGESYAVGLHHAVSLKAATRTCQDITEDDIDDIIKWASRFTNFMDDAQAFRITGV